MAISKHEEKTREKKETTHTRIPLHIVCMYARKPMYVIIRSGSISITLLTSCILETNYNHDFDSKFILWLDGPLYPTFP